VHEERVLPDVGDFDEASLSWKWAHEDPRVDRLQRDVMELVAGSDAERHDIFEAVWRLAAGALGRAPERPNRLLEARPRATIPYLTEPWYC